MSGWLRLWRPVAGRVRSDASFLLAVWLLVASATTLLAAASLYAETVETGGLRRALTEAAPAERGVAVHTTGTPAEALAADAAIRAAMAGAFGTAGAEVALTARSAAMLPIAVSNEPAARRLAVLGDYENLAAHAALVSGHWPEPAHEPVEAALSEAAATALDMGLGDRLALADASDPRSDPSAALATVEIVAIWRPTAGDPYWLGDPLDLDGVEDNGTTLFRGPFMVAHDDLWAVAGAHPLQLTWRALPHIEGMRVERLGDVRAGLAGLAGRVAAALPRDRYATVATSMADVLGTIDRSSLVSRSGIVLMTLQFGVLAGYALLLVGGLLVERRRTEVALLRARGASTPQVVALAFGEAALLALPAVLVAPWLALGLVDALGHWGAVGEAGIISGAAITMPTVAAAALGGVASVLALTLPAAASDIDLARVRAAIGRPLARTLAQRLGIDLLLVVLAAIGLLQLRTYGAPLTETTGGVLGVDPLLVSAPAVGMAAGAVLVVRLVPRLGELGERLLRRRRGLILALGARQVARRPLRLTRSALLIVLAGCLGTFAAVYTATWSRSQADQARFQAGADLRAVMATGSDSYPAGLGSSLRAIAGVTAVARIQHDQIDVGRVLRSADLVGVDPEGLAAMAAGAGPDDLDAMLNTLAATRPHLSAIELPGTPQRLGIVLDASLEAIAGWSGGIPEGWSGISVTPTVQFSDGTITRLAAARALFMGTEQRLEFMLAPATGDVTGGGDSQVRLLDVEVVIGTPAITVGDVTLRRLEVNPSRDGKAGWQTAAIVADQVGWSFVARIPRVGTHSLGGPTIHGSPEHPLNPGGDDGFGGGGAPTYVWGSPQPEAPTLAAIASERFLAETGAKVGDAISVDLHFRPVAMTIVGSVSAFPTLEATKSFILVDGGSLDVLRDVLNQGAPATTEWWLSVPAASADGAAAALRAAPFSAAKVVSRVELTRSLEADPVALGLVGALALGSLAAAAFAAIGFVVTSVVSTREGLGGFALLRALGLSADQVLGWLTLELAYLLTIGLVTGTALGILVATLVLPFALLDRTGVPVVPSPVIVVPWDLLAMVGVASLLLLAASAFLASRQVRAQSIIDLLRAQAD